MTELTIESVSTVIVDLPLGRPGRVVAGRAGGLGERRAAVADSGRR